MPELLALAMCVSLVGIVATALWLQSRRRRRRVAECQHWCAHNGYQYFGDDARVRSLSTGYPFRFGLLSQGRPRYVMRGWHRGRHSMVCQWYVKVGKSSREYEVIALALRQPYPYLDITRRRHKAQYWANKPGASPAGRDFGSAFQVTVSQAGLEPRVLSSPIPALLTQTQREDPSIFRVEGPWAIAVCPGDIDVASVGRRLELLHRFVSALPRDATVAGR